MKIVARSVKGQEFLYNAKSAHKVSDRSAKTICDILNKSTYMLMGGEVWHIHEVDSYDNAYYYAQEQSFTIRRGVVTRHYR